MRKMRLFYEAWQPVFEKRSQVANEIEIALVPDKLVPFDFAKCSQPAHELPEDFINRFLEVGFDSHMRIGYIGKAARRESVCRNSIMP